MKEKQAVTREMALEYKRATKKRKGEILDSLVGLAELQPLVCPGTATTVARCGR